MTTENPYVGPRAFQTGETLYGREVETERLFNLLLAERIVLFYSPSGAGKTSLLQAALIPRLREEGYRVSPALRANEPLPEGVAGNRYVYSVLRSLEESQPPEARLDPASLAALTLDEYLAQREAEADPEADLAGEVLLFDQFEETLTVNPTDLEDKAAFFAQVGAALRARHRWALFALREDYLAALEPYLRVLPTRGKATFRLDLLGAAAARQALQEPARASGVTFDDDAARHLVDDLRQVQVQQLDGSTVSALGPAVEPVQLQVVAYRLWESLPPDAAHIGEDALAGLGDVNRALRDYYAQSVARIAAETGVAEREIREWVERQLITAQGRRDVVARGEESSGGLANVAIGRLVGVHLVRAEQRAGTTWYELAHDRLVEPLQADNAAWFAEHLSLLQRQAVLWDEEKRADGLLLNGDAWAEAEAWAASYDGDLTPTERDFLAACREAQARARREQQQTRRIRWLAVGATVLMLLALATAFFAWGQMQRANEQVQIALARQLSVQAQYVLDNLPTQLPRALLLTVESLRRYPEDLANQLASDSLTLLPREITRVMHKGGITTVAFSPNALWGVSADLSGVLRVWETATGHEVAIMVAHEELVFDMVFSPNGQWVVSAGCEYINSNCVSGSVRIWEAATGHEVAWLKHGEVVVAVDFSADGQYLVSAGCDHIDDGCIRGSARVWEAVSGREVSRLIHNEPVRSVAFSPNGQWIVSDSGDNTARVWEATTGHEVAQVTHEKSVETAAFSPDGQWIVSSAADIILVWEASTGRKVATMTHGSYVNTVAFSPNGQWIISGSNDKTARVWEATTGHEVARVTHEESVETGAFSPDGQWVISGSYDNTARVWEAATGREVAQLPHEYGVGLVTFSPNGQRVISVECVGLKSLIDFLCATSSVRIWDVSQYLSIDIKSGREVVRITQDDHVFATIFSSDGQWILSGSRNMVRIWETTSGHEVAWLSPEGMRVLALSPNGQLAISDNDEGVARVWEVTTGHEIAWVKYESESPESLTSLLSYRVALFSPDGQLAIYNSGGSVIQVWETVNGREVARMTHEGGVRFVAFSSDGRWVISGSYDKTVRVWEVATGREIARMTHERYVTAMAFSPDGRWVVSAGCDEYSRWTCVHSSARVWEAVSGNEIARMTHEGDVSAVIFSPDGRWVVSHSGDITAWVWEATTGREIARMTHEKPVTSIAFSPQGQWVVSGSRDGTARVWEATTGAEVARMTHEGEVNSVAFSPDGRWVLSVSEDDTARVWWWQPEDMIRLACERLTRNLTREEWKQYLGDEPYRATCPNLPEAPADNE